MQYLYINSYLLENIFRDVSSLVQYLIDVLWVCIRRNCKKRMYVCVCDES